MHAQQIEITTTKEQSDEKESKFCLLLPDKAPATAGWAADIISAGRTAGSWQRVQKSGRFQLRRCSLIGVQ